MQRCSRQCHPLGSEPVRFRRSPDETKFLLSDCNDIGAANLVLDTGCLQLAGSDCSPLVIDIDSLSPLGDIAASDAVFWNERLRCATCLIGAVLNANYGLTCTGSLPASKVSTVGPLAHRSAAKLVNSWRSYYPRVVPIRPTSWKCLSAHLPTRILL